MDIEVDGLGRTAYDLMDLRINMGNEQIDRYETVLDVSQSRIKKTRYTLNETDPEKGRRISVIDSEAGFIRDGRW
jgi:hypothetical protein